MVHSKEIEAMKPWVERAAKVCDRTVSLEDERVYLQRDGKLLLINSDQLLATFQQGGANAVFDILESWLMSYHEAVGAGREYDPAKDLEQGEIYLAPPRFGRRLMLKVRTKEARDDIVR